MSPEQYPLQGPPRPATTPKHRGPAGSTDCHFHLFGSHNRYPLSPGRSYTPPEEANIETYRTLASELGIDRMVIVNPTPYGKDHSVTLDSIELFGRDRARGVAVIDDSFSDATLRDFADGGFVAARVSDVLKNTTPLSKLDEVVRRIVPLGWHLEMYVEGSTLPGLEAKILSLPIPVV